MIDELSKVIDSAHNQVNRNDKWKGGGESLQKEKKNWLGTTSAHEIGLK